MKKRKHMWTKDELKSIVDLWESRSAEEIAKEIGVNTPTVVAMATKMRKAGIKLAQKRRNGYLDLLIKEVAAEVA